MNNSSKRKYTRIVGGGKGKNIRIALLSIAGLIIVSIILFFSLRNVILRKVIDRKLTGIEQQFNIDINYSDAVFTGLSTVNLTGFTVVPANMDTLATISSMAVSVRPVDMIFNKLRFSRLTMDGTRVTLHRTGGISNYLFLLEKKKADAPSDSTQIYTTSAEYGSNTREASQSAAQLPDNQSQQSQADKSPGNDRQGENESSDNINVNTEKETGKDYGQRVNTLMKALFNYIPASTTIHDFAITANLDSNYFSFYVPDLQLNDMNFNTNVLVTEDSVERNWLVSGHVDNAKKDLKVSVKSPDSLKVTIPYIKKRFNTSFAFDSASVELSFLRGNDEVSHLKGDAILSGPLLNHPRLSPEDIELTRSEIAYEVNIGKSFIEVDSSTFISFNETGFHPYVKYVMQPTKQLTLKVNEQQLDAQAFFNSLPAGLFSNLQGIKVRGALSFILNFDIDFSNPDSLIFESRLRGKGFGIDRLGKTNFAYINEPFVYSAYENGSVARQIVVGEENPDYRTLAEIPEHLKQAIMTSEDGAFYYHNGFVPDAIRYSIITNIKEKRFARGGSTISMQLVKNIYLNRSKNITRKLEEMLITWLIESRNMVPKDRMLEVYLNIIETGPGIYGVNEAARFYFNKDVSKLTLAESIYIASIVPRPKLFKYSFDKEGNLREYLSSYYTLVSGKMLNRGWITQEDYDELRPEIALKGPARGYIITDSILPADEITRERKGFFSIFNLDVFRKKRD